MLPSVFTLHNYVFQFITFHSISRERVINSSRGWLEEMSVQGLQPGTSYRVRVVAQAEAGAGATSEVSSLFLSNPSPKPSDQTLTQPSPNKFKTQKVPWGLGMTLKSLDYHRHRLLHHRHRLQHNRHRLHP